MIKILIKLNCFVIIKFIYYICSKFNEEQLMYILITSIRQNNLNVVKLFDDDIRIHLICGTFMLSIQNNNLKVIKHISNLIKPIDAELNDALFTSSLRGNIEIVKYLVESLHANIENNDNAALSIACRSGRIDVINYLITVGADVNGLCYFDFNEIYKYTENKKEVIKILLQNGLNIDNIQIDLGLKNYYLSIKNELRLDKIKKLC